MSAPIRLLEALEDVLPDLHVELSSIYTMRWRGKWLWLVKRGRRLFVDLLEAADFWDEAGKHQVAVRLRGRAERLHASMLKQAVLADKLREAVGQ